MTAPRLRAADAAAMYKISIEIGWSGAGLAGLADRVHSRFFAAMQQKRIAAEFFERLDNNRCRFGWE